MITNNDVKLPIIEFPQYKDSVFTIKRKKNYNINSRLSIDWRTKRDIVVSCKDFVTHYMKNN